MDEDGVTLKEHFDDKLEHFNDKLNAMEKAFLQRLEGIEKAITIATHAMDRRLEGMNEFRDTLKDQAAKFVIREEMTQMVQRLETDIKNLQIARAVVDGKASQSSTNIAMAIAILGLFIAAAGFFYKGG